MRRTGYGKNRTGRVARIAFIIHRSGLFFTGLLMAAAAQGQALRLPAAPQAGYVQHLDAALPLQARFLDDDGQPVRLGDFFHDKPVVLVLGYYHCPNLCSTLFEGVLQVLALSGVAPDAYRLVGVSIDPDETPAVAAGKKRAYGALLTDGGKNTHLLTGNEAVITQLASTTGFRYVREKGTDANNAGERAPEQYAHPAGFIIATPTGRIARYFMGVRFSPDELRDALADARGGQIGTLAQQVWLLCAHYDPSTGRYSVAAMSAVRAVCMLVLALLLVWMIRQRRRRRAS